MPFKKNQAKEKFVAHKPPPPTAQPPDSKSTPSPSIKIGLRINNSDVQDFCSFPDFIFAAKCKIELNEAKKLADPANFTNPYDAEKVSKANEIFNILSQPVIKYSDYISAKNQIKELYN